MMIVSPENIEKNGQKWTSSPKWIKLTAIKIRNEEIKGWQNCRRYNINHGLCVLTQKELTRISKFRVKFIIP